MIFPPSIQVKGGLNLQMDFISLYDLCFDDIYRYILFKTGSRWDTDDIVSDVFRKAYENYGSQKGNPRGWLFTIARNTVIDYYRRKKDIAVGNDLELYPSPYRFEEDVEKRDELNCLKRSLQALSGDEIEIINLRYFAEMKYAEIGDTLGRTENSVKMKCFRITGKLRELVKKCMEG